MKNQEKWVKHLGILANIPLPTEALIQDRWEAGGKKEKKRKETLETVIKTTGHKDEGSPQVSCATVTEFEEASQWVVKYLVNGFRHSHSSLSNLLPTDFSSIGHFIF